jgi:ankyrin repeat protein
MAVSDELVEAVEQHDVDGVMRLLAAGADPNEPDREGVRPLTIAAHTPEAVVAALLEHGADPEVADAEGSTPLYLVAVAGETGKARRLLEAGADANRISAGPTDGSPLCAAACWGYRETVELLLAHGADPNLAEDEHMTPLAWAAAGMHPEVARRLLTAGANPDRGAGPRTPLIWAVERGSIETVRVLLEHGADPTVTDRNGRTAVDLAMSTGQSAIVEALEAALGAG